MAQHHYAELTWGDSSEKNKKNQNCAETSIWRVAHFGRIGIIAFPALSEKELWYLFLKRLPYQTTGSSEISLEIFIQIIIPTYFSQLLQNFDVAWLVNLVRVR